jgi:23S rRNA pseudouridine955/2504/2580 synthase
MRQGKGGGRGAGRGGPRQPGGGRGEAGSRQRGGPGFRGKGSGKGSGKGGSRSGGKGPSKGPFKGRGRGRSEERREDRFEDRREARGEGRPGRPHKGPRKSISKHRNRGEHGDFPSPREAAGRVGERAQRAEPGWGEQRRKSKPDFTPAPDPSPQGGGENSAPAATGVQTVYVSADEHNMRLDRFFEARFPGLSFSHIQRIIRKGEVRLNGKRAEPKARIEKGHAIRIPPLKLERPAPREDAPAAQKDRAFLRSITLYEDDDVMVLNKPMGLAVQGGSGTTRHVDGMLEALKSSARDAQRPRLVHRLDKDTAGCLLIAKTRFAAAALGSSFRHRSTRKLYWALVAGVPKPKQGRISTFLAKEQEVEDSYMRIARHGEEDASHAVTYYAVVETAAQKLAWVSLKPVTGRTHQLRVHMAHIGNPIVGDPKYFNIENWELPGGIQNRLHLLARRIVVPHPRDPDKVIDVSAPLPDHMQQSWNLLGFDTTRYDPIEDAPEE